MNNDRAKAIRSALLTAYNVGKAGGGDVNLPMDEASRMARADKDYPMDLYHATSGPVVGGALKEGKTYDSFGIHFGTPETANNRFLVKANELSRDANRPITMNSPNIIPSRVRINNPLRLSENRTGRWGPSDVLMETISAAERGEVPKVTAKEIDDFYNDNLKHKGKKFANLESPEFNEVLTNWLESKGYDGIVYKNTVEGGGDSYIAFRGNQTRSRFAKFDPKRAHESDLGAATGGFIHDPEKAKRRALMIASGLRKAGGGDVDFFHGSYETAPTFKIDESPRRVYSGIFGTKNDQSARSHGENLYTVKVPKNKILSNYELNYEIPYEKVSSIIKKLHPHGDQDIAHHLIVEDGDVFKTDPQELERIFRTSDAGEAGWSAQDSKGKLAKALGYDAVQTPDEHGEGTHLIVNGTAFRHTPDITKAGGGDVEPDDFNPRAVIGGNNPPTPVYYSALKQGVANAKQMQAPPQDWKAITSKLPGVRQEEIDYSGLHDFLDTQQGQVSKDALLNHLEQNPAVKLNEVWKSGTKGQNKTKFGQWTLPGGTNYQELALTLPKKAEDEKNYKSSAAHSYGDDDSDINRLAHIRMNDRPGPNGEKLLHIEELQSDWHQEGREGGYKSDSPRKQYYVKNKISGNQSQAFDSMNEATVYRDQLPENVRANVRFYEQLLPDNSRMVPDAPYKDTKDWTALALKRVMRHAANNNYDGITWTTGDQQADRYDLSKHIGELNVRKHGDNYYIIHGFSPSGDQLPLNPNAMHKNQLAETIGKELADKIVNSPHEEQKYSGLDLKVGGEGMRKYYDEIVPSVANNIAKEHGVKHSMIQYPESGKKYRIEQVGTQMGRPSYTAYDEDDNIIDRSTIRQDVEDVVKQKKGMAGEKLHYLPVTSSMKKSAKLFKSGGMVEPYKHTGVIGDAEKAKRRALMIARGLHKAAGGDVEPDKYGLQSQALQDTFAKENLPSVVVSPRPGKGGGLPITPEKGFKYDPDFEHEQNPWTFSTPNILGAPQPPPVQHPVFNEPRMKKLSDHVYKTFKSKGFNDVVEHLTGLRDLDVKPTIGTWKGEIEPSFIINHPNMTPEHAEKISHLLGFGFQQDATAHVSHNDGLTAGTPALLIGSGQKLDNRKINQIKDFSQKEGLDFTVTGDGKAAKYLHFGEESDYPDFVDKVNRIANLAKLNEKYHAATTGGLTNAKDYFKGIFGENSEGEGVSPGSSRSPDLFRRVVDHVLAPYAKAVSGEGYRLSPERLAQTYGLNDEEKEHVTNALYPSGKGDRTTIPLMTGEENLDVRPTGDRGKSSVGDVLYALQNRAAQKGQISPGDFSDTAKGKIAPDIAKEVAYHVQNSEKSAVGWYDAALKKAMEKYHAVFPELETDPDKDLMFKAILGITSQGNDVYSNSTHTARLYNLIRNDDMSLPDAVKKLRGSFGDKTRAIEQNLLKFHHLVDENGYDKMRDLFNQKKTVSDWNKELRTNNNLFDPGGSPLSMQGGKDQKVTGWMMFGPKIGSFINNLHGDYSTLTADLWFSRTWNRFLGHSFIHTPLQEAKQYGDFRDALKAEYSYHNPFHNGPPGPKTSEGEIKTDDSGNPESWLHGKDAVGMTGDAFENTINDPDKMLSLAHDVTDRYRKSGFKEKSDLRRRAKNWIENRELPVAAPRGDRERAFQQDTVEEAQKILNKKYKTNISVADIQAALWFHEKELFGKLGVASEKAAPADYADAAQKTIDSINSNQLYHVKSKSRPEKLASTFLPMASESYGGPVEGDIVRRALNLTRQDRR